MTAATYETLGKKVQRVAFEEAASEATAYAHSLQLVEEDHVSALETLQNVWVYNTVSSTLPQVVEVRADEPIVPGRQFRVFHDYLRAWRMRPVFLATATRATSETSTLISFLTAADRGAASRLDETRQLSHETEWTDEKNQRRCELVDKEIEGTLSLAEQVELEKLQTEMLAYRRKVAPLPLYKLREVHQALLREVGDQRE